MPTDLFADATDLELDQNENYLEKLVGEDKKFKTPEELARGKAMADLHIAKIEDEQRRLREELATRIKYEEFLDRLNSQPQPSSRQPQDDDDQPMDKSVMKPEEIERLLEQKLNQIENQKTASQNLNLVKQKLNEAFGPNYAQHLRRQAVELDMTEASLEQLAQTNPKALFKLLGVGEQKQGNTLFAAPPRTQNISTTMPTQGKKDKAYYDELYKTNPNEYWSPKVQNELFALKAAEMGLEYNNNS